MNKTSNILQVLPLQQGYEYPVVVESVRGGMPYVEVPYIISEEDGLYTWFGIIMRKHDYHYRGLVDAIIELKYDMSESFAVLLNYMDDPENNHYKTEYDEFQLWRKQAKDYAKKHFSM